MRMHVNAANNYYLIEKLHNQKINFETASVLKVGQLLSRREVDLEVRSLRGTNLNQTHLVSVFVFMSLLLLLLSLLLPGYCVWYHCMYGKAKIQKHLSKSF